jgi:hypothetical protein
MTLKDIVTAYFALASMVFSAGVIALSLGEAHDSRPASFDGAYLISRMLTR